MLLAVIPSKHKSRGQFCGWVDVSVFRREQDKQQFLSLSLFAGWVCSCLWVCSLSRALHLQCSSCPPLSKESRRAQAGSLHSEMLPHFQIKLVRKLPGPTRSFMSAQRMMQRRKRKKETALYVQCCWLSHLIWHFHCFYFTLSLTRSLNNHQCGTRSRMLQVLK